jgi:hypothetical protein
MPDQLLLAIYAAILKLRAEDRHSWLAEEFLKILVNQMPRCQVLTPLCIICEGEGNELHHIAGRKHDFRTATVCFECHEKLTNKQKLWDARWCKPDQPEHLKAAFLLQGISDILRLKANKTNNPIYEELADLLTEEISKRLRA